MSWRILILLSFCVASPACGQVPPVVSPPSGEARTDTAIIPAPEAPALQPPALDALLEQAAAITALKAVVVARDGAIVAERGYGAARPATPTNIKSASKSVISALVGIAIDKGVLEGTSQPIAPLLRADLPPQPDPLLARVTIGHLLSMQAGLDRTSGAGYGRWVSGSNWVRGALAQPFVDEPGGAMLYSTGSTHLLSAILTRASGRSTLELAREWLGPQDGFAISGWDRDPQGIYFGGNNMAMSTRSLLAFGELYRNGGLTADGRRLLSQAWINESWEPRTASRYTGDGYGYGWFLREIGGEQVRYAWGYGGQMLYIVPSLQLTVAMTSDENAASARSGHRDALHDLLAAIIASVRTEPRAQSTDASADGSRGTLTNARLRRGLFELDCLQGDWGQVRFSTNEPKPCSFGRSPFERHRPRRTIPWPDNDSARELVVPPLLPVVERHPEDSQEQRDRRHEVGQVAANQLTSGCILTGSGVDDLGGHDHLPRRGALVGPEHHRGDCREYPADQEICRSGQQFGFGTEVLPPVDRHQKRRGDCQQQHPVNERGTGPCPESGVLHCLVVVHQFACHPKSLSQCRRLARVTSSPVRTAVSAKLTTPPR